MKKAVLAIAALAACTSSAWAQSSVTLYGIVDAAARYYTNTDGASNLAPKQLVPGGMSQSRLGVNVTEDMGGGLKALVNMEHRLNSDTGTVAAADFWRQVWVGLQSNDFGQVRMGRQYNVLFDIYTSTYASFRYSPYIEAFKPEIVMSAGARQSNMVKYLGQVGDVYGEIQVSAGENTVSADKSIGGLLRYNDGTWGAGGAYLQVTDIAGRKMKATTVGASYTSGPLYAHVSWANNKFDAGTGVLQAGFTAGWGFGPQLTAAASSVSTRDMWMTGLTYQLTPQLNLGANYWHTTQAAAVGTGLPDSKADQLAFVADYAFSKRTDAYFEADNTRFSSGGAIRFSNGATSRTGVMVGLRHRF
ncbi:porin [Roseateles saccharophilus]|uniref:Putative porin n=2 Tax=Roseateles saccharophilus TaxID=304 RepID=A0A4R3ULH8_ROSSA|nr:porin [Roseateles saccharophilus]TCU90804.1 putative porin [Roseateles saccharophilus]